MTNYREILRLQSLGLNKSQIAAACGCSRTTVIKVLDLAALKGLRFPLPEGMSDIQLAEALFPPDAAKPIYKMPDYEYVEHEMQKSGVTLNLLWLPELHLRRQRLRAVPQQRGIAISAYPVQEILP